MAGRKRGNGQGTLYQRNDRGSWIAEWYGADGKRITRSTRTTSKADAERIKKKWVERSALEREGLVAPEGGTELDQHAAASIESHLEAFISSKRSEGLTERHVTETASMIRDATNGCGWKILGDLAPEDLDLHITRKRAPKTTSQKKRPKAWTPRTAHKHITALRTFARWCVADGRLGADPLARVKKPAPTRQRLRRMLLIEEWRWLRSVTEHGPDLMKMDGHSRRLLYELAIQTGLRSTELRSLTRSCLALDADQPHILLDASKTKNRKAARQYVQPDLAADLKRISARAMPGAPVFIMPRREKVATMLRMDLKSARQAWLDEAGIDAAERMRRESTDFLLAEDHDGRVFDFHALRHTCGAWAAVGGASPKALQTLMRHSSITLTLDTYGHLLPDEAAETVNRMPQFAPLILQMTGTDDDDFTAEQTTAVATATLGRNGANWCDGMQNEQPRFAAGGPGNAVSKRGGRDSNPQPPDRQSGTLTN